MAYNVPEEYVLAACTDCHCVQISDPDQLKGGSPLCACCESGTLTRVEIHSA